MSRTGDHKESRSKAEADWRSRRFSCGLWVDPPGQVWEDYVHATDELLMVLEGELEFGQKRRGDDGPVVVWVQGELKGAGSIPAVRYGKMRALESTT